MIRVIFYVGGEKMIITYKDNILTAYLKGEIDHHTAKIMREEIDPKIERYKPKLLVLDFGKVTFMDSSGVGLALGRYRLISQYNGQMRVDNTQPYIKKVMKLAGVDRISSFEGQHDNEKQTDNIENKEKVEKEG